MAKVVIAVFDGLQLSQISPSATPNIYRIGMLGCLFENHHSVFPSVTRINAASMISGVNPGAHGLAGNTFVARDWNANRVIHALEPELSQMASSGIQPLFGSTLQPIISEFGKEYFAIGVGTSGNAYLHNYEAFLLGGGTIHPDFSIPSGLNGEYKTRFGAWPIQTLPNTPRYKHAMSIFIEAILEGNNPDVALIWSSEPDKSQHKYGVGHSISNAAITEADHEFGRLLDYIDSRPDKEDIELMVLSDHGYSTVMDKIDIEKEMKEAGFGEEIFKGHILIAPNGGSVLIYLSDHGKIFADNIATWMMEQHWCGTILSSGELTHIEGTLPASIIRNDGNRAPDLAMSFKWNDKQNQYGFMGHVYSTSGDVGTGQHGSMSRYEMNNVLICAGKSFKKGERILSPTGNVDILPTILKLLGVSVPNSIEGRVLTESLVENDEKVVSRSTTHTASRLVRTGEYIQQILVSNVEGSLYLEEGNSFKT